MGPSPGQARDRIRILGYTIQIRDLGRHVSVYRVTVDVDALSLHPIHPADAGRIHEWTSNPEACRYQAWGPNTEAETEVFVKGAVAAWQQRPQRRWVWAVVDGDGLVDGIGEVKQHNHGCAEISYAVHIDHWGKGVGTAIGRMLTRWAFEELASVERVEATCDPRNIGSERVLRRVGMTYEGTLRHTMLIRDGWRDSKMFSILRGEWTR